MMSATLVWGSPGWVWPVAALAAVSLALLVWSYRRAGADVGTKSIAGVFKALGIAALLLCLI